MRYGIVWNIAKQKPEYLEPMEIEATKEKSSPQILVGYLDVERSASGEQEITLSSSE